MNINDEELNKTKIPNFFSDAEIPKNFVGKCFITMTNAYAWVNNKGLLNFHREDGPAIIWVNKNNSIVIGFSWILEGKNHRIGGPSYLHGDNIRYYINDEHVLPNNYWKHPLVQEWKLEKIVML